MRFAICLAVLLFPAVAWAAVDTDGDGLTDDQEIKVYYSDPFLADTDGDGYDDNEELVNGFSPTVAGRRLIELDSDGDGLNDGYELALKTDIKNPDTDNDGFSDGQEFNNGYDPTTAGPVKLSKSILIDLSEQQLWRMLGPVILNKYQVSTGKASTPTPVGQFAVQNKYFRPFSKMAGLYMPYWLGFNGPYGMHELPEWPGGFKEGAEHLGTPVSHGCVRLSHEAALTLYHWADIGTPVMVRP